MPKAKVSKFDRIRSEHEAFLRRMGVDPAKRIKLQGVPPNTLVAQSLRRSEQTVSTSDTIPGNGTRRDVHVALARSDESAETIRAMQAVQQSVAQLYPKGPFGPVTDPNHLKTNVRRPPIL